MRQNHAGRDKGHCNVDVRRDAGAESSVGADSCHEAAAISVVIAQTTTG